MKQFFHKYKTVALTDKDFIAIGSIQENRTNGAFKSMISNKDMKKNNGSYNYCSNDDVCICKIHKDMIFFFVSARSFIFREAAQAISFLLTFFAGL